MFIRDMFSNIFIFICMNWWSIVIRLLYLSNYSKHTFINVLSINLLVCVKEKGFKLLVGIIYIYNWRSTNPCKCSRHMQNIVRLDLLSNKSGICNCIECGCFAWFSLSLVFQFCFDWYIMNFSSMNFGFCVRMVTVWK